MNGLWMVVDYICVSIRTKHRLNKHSKQDDDNQNAKNTTQKTKKMSNMDTTKLPGGGGGGRETNISISVLKTIAIESSLVNR
jgi:hypothetical protein